MFVDQPNGHDQALLFQEYFGCPLALQRFRCCFSILVLKIVTLILTLIVDSLYCPPDECDDDDSYRVMLQVV